jgi:hypothetical protein
VELRTIFTTHDPTWDGVNITIWSQAELSLGILIASLPPLRKALTSVFQRILPSTLTGSRKTPMYGQGYAGGQGHSGSGNVIMDNLRGSKAYHSRIHGESVLDADDDSDRAILEEGAHTGHHEEYNGDSKRSIGRVQHIWKRATNALASGDATGTLVMFSRGLPFIGIDIVSMKLNSAPDCS